ncbi:MAG: HPr family phosphocarrier protein [Oscillospiraceae bacterium]|nr:HPr family phosphocarrier protein [Oscillospiraceae bacterium]
MFTENITLSSVNDVKRFVNLVSGYKFKVELISGRYTVDAKSIMGVFSLDLMKPIKMTAYTDDASFIDEVKQFITQ